jgi:hypothetical protein
MLHLLPMQRNPSNNLLRIIHEITMPLFLIGAIVVVVAAVVIVILFLKRSKPKSPPVTDTVNIYRSILGNPAGATPAPPSFSHATPPLEDAALTARLHQDLRLKFLYQEDKVENAIQFERDRNPTASLNDLMQAAIARYERDNH